MDHRKKQRPRPRPRPPAPDTWLATAEAASHLGITPKTLANMRSLGTGPHFHKFGGKVWYRSEDILAYRNRNRYRGTGMRHES